MDLKKLLVVGVLVGCSHQRSGPRPVLEGVQLGQANAVGERVVFGHVRVDFKDLASASHDKKVDHLLQAVTFTVFRANGEGGDRVLPAVVVGSVKTQDLVQEYPHRVGFEFAAVCPPYEGSELRLLAENVFRREGDAPVFIDLHAPEEPPPVAVSRVTVHLEDEGPARLQVELDRDAPISLRVYDVSDGRVHGLQRVGTRLYERVLEVGDGVHRVFLELAGQWLSPPRAPGYGVESEEE